MGYKWLLLVPFVAAVVFYLYRLFRRRAVVTLKNTESEGDLSDVAYGRDHDCSMHLNSSGKCRVCEVGDPFRYDHHETSWFDSGDADRPY